MQVRRVTSVSSPLATQAVNRRRANNVQLVRRYGRTRCTFVPVFVVGLVSLDLGVYRIAYSLVGPACRVLVDDRSALAVMSHPPHRHGPTSPRVAASGEGDQSGAADA